MNTLTVSAPHPVRKPPMTPPSASAPASSAMTVISPSSAYSLSSSAIRVSPGRAQAQVQIATHPVGVEDVQRPVEPDGQEIGDVDQGRDRPQPDGHQAVLEPGRAVRVGDAADGAADEVRAGVAGRLVEVQMHGDRAGEGAGYRFDGERTQDAGAGRRQVAGDAAHAQAVAPVGGHGDVDDRIVEAHDGGGGGADGRLGGQFDDAVVVLAEAHLALGQQHAVADDAADFGLFERASQSGQVGAGGGEDGLHAGLRVGGAAHHLDFAGAGLDAAHLEAVGVRMGCGLDDAGDGEITQAPGAVIHALDLEADHVQGLGDGRDGRVGLEVLLEPTEGELHASSPVVMVGTSRARKP